MAKPCRIADTVCVQPCREVIDSIFCPWGCSSTYPEGCPSDPFEGLSVRPPGGLSEDPSGGTIRRAVPMPPGELPGDPSGELMWEYILAVGRL